MLNCYFCILCSLYKFQWRGFFDKHTLIKLPVKHQHTGFKLPSVRSTDAAWTHLVNHSEADWQIHNMVTNRYLYNIHVLAKSVSVLWILIACKLMHSRLLDWYWFRGCHCEIVYNYFMLYFIMTNVSFYP